jgi:plasmid replication initiation protein
MKNNEKSNSLVVYKNDFNTVPLRNFTATEMNLLFTIMSKMRNQGLNSIKFNFHELKELSKYNKETAIKSFVDDLESTYDKLIQLNVKIGNSRQWTKFVFFTKYSVDIDEQTVEIKINEEFKHLINEISGNFTKLELEEITTLKSSYSKNLYRLLKQYRSTGYRIFTIEEFRELMDIPDSYKMGNIDQQILTPIKKQLPPYFHNLKIKKIKGTGRDSRKIKYIEFTFSSDDGLYKGNRTFRNKDGEYYEKYISDFTPEEIKKAYP